VQRARAVLANLGKGRRPAELDVIAAQLGEAEAALRLARSDLERETALVARRFTAPARLDQLRAAVARAQAQVAGQRAQLRVAHAAARPDELRAAEQDVHAAEAELAQANWKLDQKTVTVPVAAQVADVLYRPGELVPAGAPVVSLLVPAYVRARFFVPEAVLGRLRLGQPVTLRCDGCAAPLAATISYIAPQAEYTAPLIYSQENRADLVFLVEARPDGAGAAALHPGQPLAVRLADAAQGAR
jgi:HlyD family secretion protein